MTPDELARQWLNGLRISHMCHARMTSRYEHRGRAFSVLVVVLSAVVGTAIFSSMSQSPANWAKLVTGGLSVLAAVCAGMNTALRYPELAERHRESGVAYGELRRRFEQRLSHEGATEDLLSTTRADWDRIDASAPGIPRKVHAVVTGEVRAAAAESRQGVQG